MSDIDPDYDGRSLAGLVPAVIQAPESRMTSSFSVAGSESLSDGRVSEI